MPDLDDGSSRRAFLVSGIAAATLFASGAAAFARGAACALTPEQEEGPFYVPASPVRSNLALGQRGIPLAIELRVIDVRTCAAIPQASVDIWHCDAMGVYSGFAQLGGGPGRPDGASGMPPPDRPDGMRGIGTMPPHVGPPPHGAPPKLKPSNGLRFLRGVAATGSDGVAHFDTIFPGFYRGRVNHVHLKVRVPGSSRVVHTGQLFFPEAIASAVSARPPYSAHAVHRTTLLDDGVYGGERGSSGMADVLTAGSRGAAYVARLTLVVDRAATPAPVRF